jgi:uncharacterized BrkB/YihY/UPF0761 family membrane protein
LGDKLKAFAASDSSKTAVLGVLFAGWYATNIVFNLFNKQVLNIRALQHSNPNSKPKP